MKGGWWRTGLKHLLAAALLVSAAAAEAFVTASAVVQGSNQSSKIAWIAVTLSNPSSRSVEGQLEFSGYDYRGSSSATFKGVSIPPGGSQTYNIAVPVINTDSGKFRETNGDQTPLNLNNTLGYDSYRDMYLYASEQSNRLTDDELDAFSYKVNPDSGSGISAMGVGTVSTTRSLTASERAVSQISLDAMPENWLCYTPLKTVVMSDSGYRRLSAPRRQAIDTWLVLGGHLILFGTDENTTKSVERGRIIFTHNNPITDSEYRHEDQLVPFIIGDKLSDATMPYQESSAGGRGGAFALATIFLIIVGPVNYWYFSRRNDIRKLLITVPLISLGFCSLIAAYFVLTQGFNRKGGSLTITTVDEANNRAITLAKHSLLTGLYPLGGFHFSSETYLHPKENEQRESARFDLTREIVLESGLFQPGIPFDYSTIKPYTTRERMMYDAEAGMVRNGFELPLKAVAVLHDGQYYIGGAAASGGQVKMDVVDDNEVATIQKPRTRQAGDAARMVQLLGRQLLETAELDAAANLAADVMDYPAETSGTLYVALLDGEPKSAEPGVEISDGRNLHLVIGRTAQEEAE